MNKKKRNTIILSVLILAAALGGILAQRVFLSRDGGYAIVQSYGEELTRLPLSKDTELMVGDAKIGYNRIRVENGMVFVEEADCPDKICVREGRKQNTGEVIACLPHELIIVVEGAGDMDTYAP